MKFFLQLLIRIVPIIVLVIIGYLGVQHWQKPKEKTSISDAPSPERSHKKKGSKKSEVYGESKHKGPTSTFLSLESTQYLVQLQTQGILSAVEKSSISSEVAGIVIYINPNFAAGAFIDKGDILLKIDNTAKLDAIISAQADLARAEASYAQEVAKGEQALRNWQDIGYKEAPNDLVLRKPQLEEAQANVLNAETSLKKANRELEKCTVKAPFSGVIRSKDFGLGEQISPGNVLGELLATNYAEVRLPLNSEQLRTLRKGGNSTPPVTFKNALEPDSPESWNGQIVRSEGELDLESKELFLIARIEDPFNLKKKHTAPLLFNQPVLASIPAVTLENVIKIAREHTLGYNEVIIIQNNEAQRLKLDPVWQTSEFIVVDAELIPKKAYLSTSRLDFATDGLKVTLVDESGEPVESASNSDSATPENNNSEASKPKKEVSL